MHLPIGARLYIFSLDSFPLPCQSQRACHPYRKRLIDISKNIFYPVLENVEFNSMFLCFSLHTKLSSLFVSFNFWTHLYSFGEFTNVINKLYDHTCFKIQFNSVTAFSDYMCERSRPSLAQSRAVPDLRKATQAIAKGPHFLEGSPPKIVRTNKCHINLNASCA